MDDNKTTIMDLALALVYSTHTLKPPTQPDQIAPVIIPNFSAHVHHHAVTGRVVNHTLQLESDSEWPRGSIAKPAITELFWVHSMPNKMSRSY